MDRPADNVTPMFSMDVESLKLHQATLAVFPVDPMVLRIMLKNPASDPHRGRRLVVFGLVAAVVELLVAGVGLAYGLSATVTGAFMVLAVLAALVAETGRRRLRTADKIIRRSRDARLELEGESGFLWRFEPILMGVDVEEPLFGDESLSKVCGASRTLEAVDARDSLYEYWYWVSLLKPIVERIPTDGLQ